jgi:enoyl-CoA hydratase
MTTENRGHLIIEREGQVATIKVRAAATLSRDELSQPRGNNHWELAQVLSELRGDNSVRVVVLTGSEEGIFMAAPRSDVWESDDFRSNMNDPTRRWLGISGTIRCHETIASMEKPIVARVNGDAIGFGSSMVFACDIVVAQEDAKIVDFHMGMGEVKTSGGISVGPPFGIVPGDGGAALMPLYMVPSLAKEYLMLSREYTAKELAQWGMINHAVPADQLDAKVQDIVDRLLQRSAYALAWTKRVANRHVIDQLNRTLDAGLAWEILNLSQIEKMGWEDKLTLD